MHTVVSTSSSRLVRSVLVAIVATFIASPLLAQVTREKPLQMLGLGMGSWHANGNTQAGIGGAFNINVSRLFMSVGTVYMDPELGDPSLNNDYQVGYAFLRRNDATANDRTVWALAGGLYHPMEGDMRPMISLTGFSGRHSWKIAMHAMIGYMFPEAGDGVTMIRIGLGVPWQ